MSELFTRWRRWRKVKKAMRRLYLWELCPGCNSDAPEIDDCVICDGSGAYPIPPKTKLGMATVYLLAVALEEDAAEGGTTHD